MSRLGYKQRNRNALRCNLETDSDSADVMSDGRSFRLFAPKNGKARLTTTTIVCNFTFFAILSFKYVHACGLPSFFSVASFHPIVF